MKFKKKKEQEKSKEKKKGKEEKETMKLDDLLAEAITSYNESYTEMNDNGMSLYTQRERSMDLIDHVEVLVNSIASRPKSFDAELQSIEMSQKNFKEVCDFAKQELEDAKKSALGAGSGIAAATAVASLAPTGAIWIATTFGTASTGTAISTLSGAAATNAALAWLGGGALTAGGGGMAAGSALLALAGPIGWSIAGASVLGSVVLFTVNKIKGKKAKKEEIEKVKKNTEANNEVAAKIQTMVEETVSLRERLKEQYGKCLGTYQKNFALLSEEDQQLLGALVNNTKSLAKTLESTL